MSETGDGKHLQFFGLDIEATGSDFTLPHKLIQIGVATYSFKPDVYESKVGWEWGEFDMVPEALAVHKIPSTDVIHARRADIVDEELYRWLREHGAQPKRCVPVGFNVGTFDMPFVRRDLPMSAALFSRRSVDLNAVLFSMGEALSMDWLKLKELSKHHAKARAERVLPGYSAHNAAFDAVEAVFAWTWALDGMRLGDAFDPCGL